MNALLWWLLQSTIALAILIPIAATLCLLFRYRPAVQHTLWLIVLLKCVTPTVVAWPWTLEDARWALGDAPLPATESAQPVSVAVSSPMPTTTLAAPAEDV